MGRATGCRTTSGDGINQFLKKYSSKQINKSSGFRISGALLLYQATIGYQVIP